MPKRPAYAGCRDIEQSRQLQTRPDFSCARVMGTTTDLEAGRAATTGGAVRVAAGGGRTRKVAIALTPIVSALPCFAT